MSDEQAVQNRWLVLGDSGPREYVHPDGEQVQEFGPLSRINLFVGANNAGKSRFMRSILRWNHIDEGSKEGYVLVPTGDQRRLLRQASAAEARLKGIMSSRFPTHVHELKVLQQLAAERVDKESTGPNPIANEAADKFRTLAE
jgi:hypothetical protein